MDDVLLLCQVSLHPLGTEVHMILLGTCLHEPLHLPLVICGQYVCTIISKLYGVKFCSLRQLWILLLNDLSDDVHDDGDLYYLDLEDEGSKHGPLTNPSGDINRVTDMSGNLDTVGPAHPV